MEIDKWCVMKILNEMGIISFDEWNYELMDVGIIFGIDIETVGINTTWSKIIQVNFGGGVKETIDLDYYTQYVRDNKINEILK